MKKKLLYPFLAISTLISGLFVYQYKYGTELDVITGASFKEGSKICFIGDSGEGNAAQKKVAEYLEKENCDQVRHTGDIIYPIGIKKVDDPDFFEKFYNIYKPMLDKKIPFYMSLGNHDYLNCIDCWIKISETYEDIKFPYYYYAEQYGDICFFTLDTNVFADLHFDHFIKKVTFNKDTHRIKFSKNQKEWLKKQLESVSCKTKILVGHHPYKSSGKHGDAKGDIKKFYEKYVIDVFDILITGHDHNIADEGLVGEKTLQFVSGGGGGSLRPVKNPGVWGIGNFGYITMIIYEDQFIFDFKFLDNDNNLIIGHTRKYPIKK